MFAIVAGFLLWLLATKKYPDWIGLVFGSGTGAVTDNINQPPLFPDL